MQPAAEGRLPEENDLTPELIRGGAEQLLRIVGLNRRDSLLPPLTPDYIALILSDVLRAPLMASYGSQIRLRDRVVEGHAGIDVHVTPSYLTARERGEARALDTVFGTGHYRSRSLAGIFYYRSIEVVLTGGGRTDTFVNFMNAYVPADLWLNDDIPGMHQAYLDTLTYADFRDSDPSVWNLAIRVARALYDVSTAEYRPGLLSRLRRYRLEWRRSFREWAGSQPLPLTATLDTALTMLEAVVESEENRHFGAGSYQSREAIDRSERTAGQLTPECDFWTYEELEHWARWLLFTLTVPQLCEIVREQKALFELLGPVVMEEPCERIERAELLDVIVRGVRASPKRGLCLLLSRYTSPPPVVRWSSQRWYNLDVLADYLPADVASRLTSEQPDPREVFVFEDRGEGGPKAERTFWVRDRVFERRNIEGSDLIRGYVAWDLARNAFRDPLTSDEYQLYLAVTRQSMSTTEAPRRISSAEHHGPGELWVALVVVQGLLAVSVISTNQTTERTKDGELVVETEEIGQLLSPQSLVLQAGDVLVANLSKDAVLDGATTPFDLNAFYDVLILRAAAEGTVWFEYLDITP